MPQQQSHLRLEPLLWTLFSAGGVVAAFFLPVHIFLFGIAFPLGWLKPPAYASLMALVSHPLVRIYLFVLCSVPLFHFAHRFRYTLYDGLQLAHLYGLIATVCYGGATLVSAVAAWVLWRFP